MAVLDNQQRSLHTSTGEFPLHEYRLRAAGREWTSLHTGAVLTLEDEAHFFRELRDRANVSSRPKRRPDNRWPASNTC